MTSRIRLIALLAAILMLTGAASGCERLRVHGEGGSSSEPEIDIGIRF